MQTVSDQAYQVAENTHKSRHSKGCGARGVGALLSKLSAAERCTCWVVYAADRKAETDGTPG